MSHIRRLGELGGYNTDHFFRVDKGFVAQVADVSGGRTAKLSAAQQVRVRVPGRAGADRSGGRSRA